MVNINLQQIDSTKKVSSSSFVGTKFYISMTIIALPLAVYGGLKMYSDSLAKKITDVKMQIQTESGQISDASLRRVANFKVSLDNVEKTILSQDNAYYDFFKYLQDSMVAGVVVTGVKYDLNVTEISLMADNFQSVAKQLASFKKNPVTASLEVISSDAKTEAGKIKFGVKVSFNKKIKK